MLRPRCQREAMIGAHGVWQRLRGRLAVGLGLRTGLMRRFRGDRPAPDGKAAPARLGAPSRFEPGSWVRVRDADSVRTGLDDKNRLRGLVFVPEQWSTCGHVSTARPALAQAERPAAAAPARSCTATSGSSPPRRPPRARRRPALRHRATCA
jgi:hypothetical protein